MPITSCGLGASVSPPCIIQQNTKQKYSFVGAIRRIFNTGLSLKRIGTKIDKPHNEKLLGKELIASKNLWAKVSSRATTSSNEISCWTCESENYTTLLPQELSPYRDKDTQALVSALNHMPKYNGILYRVDDAPGFLNGNIKEGDVVISKRLLSFSSSLEFVKSFRSNRKVFFALEASETARNISGYRFEQAESVVSIDSAFKVKKIITTEKGAIVVHLKEHLGQLYYGDSKNMYTGECFLVRRLGVDINAT